MGSRCTICNSVNSYGISDLFGDPSADQNYQAKNFYEVPDRNGGLIPEIICSDCMGHHDEMMSGYDDDYSFDDPDSDDFLGEGDDE